MERSSEPLSFDFLKLSTDGYLSILFTRQFGYKTNYGEEKATGPGTGGKGDGQVSPITNPTPDNPKKSDTPPTPTGPATPVATGTAPPAATGTPLPTLTKILDVSLIPNEKCRGLFA
jgi:hypothetical protein